MNKPLLSIICPVYNVENYLDACITSVLDQYYDNFELLLINDGSKDSSGGICDKYAKQDVRVKVFHKENGGVSSARNFGLKKCQGEYIAFIDSDDTISQDAYQDNILIMENNQKIELLQFPCYFRYTSPAQYIWDNMDILPLTITSHADFAVLFSKRILSNSLCGKIFRKKIIHNVVFPEGRVYEDLYVFAVALENIRGEVYLSNIGMYYYYERPMRILHSGYNFKKWSDKICALIKMYSYTYKYATDRTYVLKEYLIIMNNLRPCIRDAKVEDKCYKQILEDCLLVPITITDVLLSSLTVLPKAVGIVFAISPKWILRFLYNKLLYHV